MEAQATRRVPLKNRKLVTKREDLHLQDSTGSKSGGYQCEKGDEKRAHRSHHDLTNGRNLCVFRPDGVFGSHKSENAAGEKADTFGGKQCDPLHYSVTISTKTHVLNR